MLVHVDVDFRCKEVHVECELSQVLVDLEKHSSKLSPGYGVAVRFGWMLSSTLNLMVSSSAWLCNVGFPFCV